jgi:hypothetical protein
VTINVQPLQQVTIDTLPKDIAHIPHSGGKLFYAPSLLLPDAISQEWKDSLKKLVDDDLKKLKGRDPHYSICLCTGASEDRKSWAPSIVIGCKTEKQRKRIEKRFKKDKWLVTLPKLELQLKIIIDPSLGLLAKPNMSKNFEESRTEALSLRPIGIAIGQQNSQKSLCGAQIKRLHEVGEQAQLSSDQSDDDVVATLGGLILVSGKIYGLTVGHPFAPSLSVSFPEDDSDSFSSSPSGEGDEASSRHDELPTSHDSTHTSNLAFGVESIEIAPDQLSMFAERSVIHMNIGEFQPSGSVVALALGEYHAVDQSWPSKTVHLEYGTLNHSDWALIELDKSKIAKNSFLGPGERKVASIGSIEYKVDGKYSSGQVWVIAGRTGVQKGILNGTPGSFMFNRLHLDVHHILLDHPLGKISST